MTHGFRWLTGFGVALSAPYAFAVVLLYGAVWFAYENITFASVATIAVWLMTLFIQRAQHRDTLALHAKLDELLRAHHDARSELRSLDDDEPEEIEEFRENERIEEEGRNGDRNPAGDKPDG